MTLAIIGGSGLYNWPGASVVREFPAQTPWGDASAAPRMLQFDEGRCLFLPRHGVNHERAPHAINYRANMAAMQAAGATAVIAVNTVGGITPECVAGALVLPGDVIDYTWGRAHTFHDTGDVQHVDFSEPYDARLRVRIANAARDVGLQLLDGGVYAATQGPRLESPAEIRRLERDGCTVVGMTGMPETALARELALPYAALCLVVNAAAGKGSEPITMAAIEAVMADGMAAVRALLLKLVVS